MKEEIKRGDYAREKGEIILREHEYDGIQEYDQKLPNWWLFTFYAAIVWFVVYWVLYYHTGVYRTDQERVVAELRVLEEKKQQVLAATLESLDDVTLITKWAKDPAVVAAGEATYQTYCVVCHAQDLSATMKAGESVIPLPGLSLADGQWKYGGKPMEVFRLIHDGTPPESTGHQGARMQAWGQVLTAQQIAELTAFLIEKNPKDFPAP